MTPRKMKAITLKIMKVGKDQEVLVREDTEEGTAAPGTSREEEEEDLEEDMAPMRRRAGDTLARRDENSAQGP